VVGSGAPAPEPAAGLLRGGLFLRLLAQVLLLLALAFVGFGLAPGCDSPALAVLSQMRVRLARLAPVP
jgi:hypothetical protein